MALTGNKGEWSEIYTLFRLLGEGKVYAGDADMNKLDIYYPIINVIREESKKYEYKPNIDQNIVIIDEDGNKFATISMDKFMEQSKSLLNDIKNGRGLSFPIASTESFMTEIGCKQLKATSKDKADIHIVIHDLRTNMKPLLGFSIKSQLGTPATLLNAGKTTNFTYKVTGKKLTQTEISDINSIDEQTLRMEKLSNIGCSLEYFDVDNKTFKNNLLFIDCCLPQFIADCLTVDSMPNSTSSIKSAVEKISIKNPLHFTGKDIEAFYAHKMKMLLLDAALGMTPAKEWTGHYDANGGYLVVKKDGDIVCYHFYNRNEVEDYLYNNTRFERASRSRYGFGNLYQENGETFIKLNLQIRFKK